MHQATLDLFRDVKALYPSLNKWYITRGQDNAMNCNINATYHDCRPAIPYIICPLEATRPQEAVVCHDPKNARKYNLFAPMRLKLIHAQGIGIVLQLMHKNG